MTAALYANDGFYRNTRPARHFSTSSHVDRLFATALWVLLTKVDRVLDGPENLDVVDVGGGGGELLCQLWQLAQTDEDLGSRVRLVGVDLASRPPDLPESILWRDELPTAFSGLLLANEWLDNVPVDVAERVGHGSGLVTVNPNGDERPGGRLTDTDAAWLERWWALDKVGHRAEIGHTRDTAWAGAVKKLNAGLALAIDYGHLRADRPTQGSLTGYRLGRQQRPIPDGSCDITAHVAFDSVAAAGRNALGAGAAEPILVSQREALRALGVRGGRPPRGLASTHPATYLQALGQATHAAELLDSAGLGGFFWLGQPVGLGAADRRQLTAALGMSG